MPCTLINKLLYILVLPLVALMKLLQVALWFINLFCVRILFEFKVICPVLL